MDVFFGGGVPDHQLAADSGYLEPAKISETVLSGIPPQIAGVSNLDPKHRWFGSALSSFGIIYNKKGIENQELHEVTTWADLASPKMYSWVIVADPRKSTSVRVAYELILQKYGWEKGWPLLMKIVANARTIAASSSAIPNEVSGGDVLAGPCIDFYGYAQMAKAGSETIGYVNPKDGSAITPDPISMLRKPPHREMAEKFIEFVLSPDGQRLWVLPVGAKGGPTEHELRRLPIRPDVCAEHADEMLVQDPFKQAGEGVFMTVDGDLQNRRNPLVRDLMGAALIDLHSDLRAAWKAMIDGGMKPAAVAEWNKLPFSNEEALKYADQLAEGGMSARRLTRQWARAFKQKYERVIELSK
jgi:ABC-type Fe3+ transport system substrate-binding protein